LAVKRAFLERLAECGNTSAAARQVGISRESVRLWIQADQVFAEAYDQAQEQATERLEEEAWRRAMHGVTYTRRSYWKGEVVGEDIKTEYSDNLMMLLLRARAPHKYREQLGVDIRQVVKVVAGIDPLEVLGSGLGSSPPALNSGASEPENEAHISA